MHALTLWNSLGNELQEFKPIVPGEVSMYVCGPTVYASPHIGNMRPAIVFDTLRRLLIHLGYKVTYVSNYTDVDDKIIARAKELGVSEAALTEGVIKEYARLIDQIGCLQPDIKPRPTVYMPQIISYIGDLVKNGSAYVSHGDVYFRISSIQGYGELSGNTPEQLLNGARIEVNSEKESPVDFALWKATDEGIQWDSPWSKGRPGWHTECCVMINSIFAKQNGLIDIHGGGFDLKFPHHENEMAQAKAHNHNKLAHYWIHNGFININNEKMSKSLGNVLLAKDVVAQYGGIAFRLMILNAYYRAPVSFSEETIKEAQTNLEKLQTTYKQLAVQLQVHGVALSSLKADDESKFLDALCQDLNTPNALSVLYEEVKNANQLLRANPLNLEALSVSFARLKDYFFVLGLGVQYPNLSKEDVALYESYLAYKKAKDFAQSDLLRGQLIQKGIL